MNEVIEFYDKYKKKIIATVIALGLVFQVGSIYIGFAVLSKINTLEMKESIVRKKLKGLKADSDIFYNAFRRTVSIMKMQNTQQKELFKNLKKLDDKLIRLERKWR